MIRTILGVGAIALVLSVAAANAQPACTKERPCAPNESGKIWGYTEEFADAWSHAHGGGPRSAEWIKLVVKALRRDTGSKQWCINGKRATSTPSEDAVAYLMPDHGGNFRRVEVYDVIGGAGGANPTITWQNMTNYVTVGGEGTALCIAPDDVPLPGAPPAPTPSPTPQPTPTPQPPAGPTLQQVLDAVADLRGKLDTIAGVATEARDAAHAARDMAEKANANASDVKHVTVPQAVEQLQAAPHKCLEGRVPKAFGGSAVVVFCPTP